MGIILKLQSQEFKDSGSEPMVDVMCSISSLKDSDQGLKAVGLICKALLTATTDSENLCGFPNHSVFLKL